MTGAVLKLVRCRPSEPDQLEVIIPSSFNIVATTKCRNHSVGGRERFDDRCGGFSTIISAAAPGAPPYTGRIIPGDI